MNDTNCKGKIHIVKEGDSLYTISKEHGVALDEVMDANPYVDVYNLQIGSYICVPMKNNKPDDDYESGMMAYVVRDGDSIENIINKFDITLAELVGANKLSDMLLKSGITVMVPLQQRT